MAADENKNQKKEESPRPALRVKFGSSRKLALVGGLVLANILVLSAVLVFAMRKSPPAKVVAPTEPVVVDPLRTSSRADVLLLNGRHKEALELYRVAATTTSPYTTAITYRLALSMEVIGNLKESAQFYQIANNHDLTEISLAAQLGEARVYYKLGDFEAAARVLSPLAGVSVLPVLSKTSIGIEVGFLRALAHSARAQTARPSSIMDPRHLFRETIQVSIADALQLVPLESSQLAMPVPIGDDTRMEVKILGEAREPNTTLVSCGFRRQPAIILLDLIARESGWKVAITPPANEILSAKRVDILLRDKSMGELLSIVLEPQGLFWNYDVDTLVIDRIENFPRKTVVLRHRNQSSTLLLNALAEAPSHRLAPQAYLALGNLAAMNERFEHAATFYQDVRERYPKHAVSQRASLNLARLFLAQSKRERAETVLNDIVDGRGNFELAPLAFLMLGDMHIGTEDLNSAKQELSRSLALAAKPEVEAAAAMTLASVYLLQRTDSSSSTANAVLMEHREVLRDPRWSEAAVFLSALTRYRVEIRSADVTRRGRELIAAATKVDPSSFFGGYGFLLVGDAFSELSLVSEATRLYADGLEKDVPDPIHDMLLYRLATEYRNQNEFALARTRLQELSAKASSGLSPIAAIDLAQMLLQISELQVCIQHCRESLQKNYAEQHNVKLLITLGQAYEELGSHEQASLCFAGFLPTVQTLQSGELRR